MYAANNQLYDTPGRLQSPYISMVAFGTTGMQSRFETPDGVVNFVFRQDCYFTNSSLSVSSIYIDEVMGRAIARYNGKIRFHQLMPLKATKT
jgi:hypothetical protein